MFVLTNTVFPYEQHGISGFVKVIQLFFSLMGIHRFYNYIIQTNNTTGDVFVIMVHLKQATVLVSVMPHPRLYQSHYYFAGNENMMAVFIALQKSELLRLVLTL